jgi:hypothetical protein
VNPPAALGNLIVCRICREEKRMSPAVSAHETGPPNSRLASRYEALIGLAEAIRSRPERGDLFQAFAYELNQVIRFDAIAQFDGTALVQWNFLEPYNKDLEAFRSSIAPDEETVVRWVYRNQQPVVIRFSDRDGRFPYLEPVWRLGMRSLCAFPLSTAHRQLGSLLFASHLIALQAFNFCVRRDRDDTRQLGFSRTWWTLDQHRLLHLRRQEDDLQADIIDDLPGKLQFFGKRTDGCEHDFRAPSGMMLSRNGISRFRFLMPGGPVCRMP